MTPGFMKHWPELRDTPLTRVERGVFAGWMVGVCTGLVFTALAYSIGDSDGYDRGWSEGHDALVAYTRVVGHCVPARHLDPADIPGRR